MIAISDLHGQLPEIPEEDLLLIAGDIIPLSIQSDDKKSGQWFRTKFSNWIDSLPVNKVLFIAGNHDWSAYRGVGEYMLKDLFNKDSKATYLFDESYIYKDITIYGTPWCKMFYNWAFNLNDEALKEKYSNIPNNVDVLLTHDAPYGTNDIVENYNKHIGNIPLRDIILEKTPKYNIHGHLHTAKHEFEVLGNTKVCNCSLLDEEYKMNFKPIIFENE